MINVPPPVGDAWYDRLKTITEEDEEAEEDDPMLPPSVRLEKDILTATKDMSTVSFPLYSINPSLSDDIHAPCGTLPLVGFWVKKQHAITMNRIAGNLKNIISLNKYSPKKVISSIEIKYLK